WGVFYDAITLNQLALTQEQISLTTFYAPGDVVAGTPIETRFVLKAQDLRLPRYVLASLSAEQRLPRGVFGKFTLMSREGSRGFTFQDLLVGPALNLYVLDNVQQQRYRAAEFTLRRTSLSRYQWSPSSTRSASDS